MVARDQRRRRQVSLRTCDVTDETLRGSQNGGVPFDVNKKGYWDEAEEEGVL